MLLADRDHEVARATVLRMRSDDVDTSGSVHPPVDDAARARPVDAQTFPFGEGAIGFWNVHDVRLVAGQLDRTRSRHRVVPPAVPGDRGRADLADRARRGGRRLRQRGCESGAADERDGDQSGGDRARAPAPGRRVGVPRVGCVGAAARRRYGRARAARRGRRDRPRCAVAARRAGGESPDAALLLDLAG